MVGAAAKFRNNERYNLHRGNTSINDRFIKLSEIYGILEDSGGGISQAQLDAAIAALIGGAPVDGDTLGELYTLIQARYKNIDIALADFQALELVGVSPLTTYTIYDAINTATKIKVTTDSSGSFSFSNSPAIDLTNQTYGNYDAINDLYTQLGTGTGITVVANYSALPAANTVSGEFYWCSTSQGTSWLPGSLGGTYYNSGMYYSNGTTWEYIETPYEATQAEVNTGTDTNKFVTPATLNNYSGWTKTKVGLSNVENTALSTWAGTSNITTLGTIGTGTWNGSLLTGTYGGTGVNNASRTITIAGNLITTGAFNTTFAQQATATITLPSATSTLLADNLGISGGSRWISGTLVSDKVVIQATSFATHTAARDLITLRKNSTTPAASTNVLMTIGDGQGLNNDEVSIYTGINSGTTGYLLRAGATFAYFNASSSLRLQIAAADIIQLSSSTATMTQGITLSDAKNYVGQTTTGNKCMTSTTQKYAFWNATPIIQPANANQAALTDSTTGTPSFTLVDVGAIFSQANINNNFSSLYRIVNEFRNVLVNTGLMKGAA